VSDLRAVIIGTAGTEGERIERWHDDVLAGARELGWAVEMLPPRGPSTEDFIRAAKGADLLLWLRTHNHNITGDGWSMLRRIEDMGVSTNGLHLDLYWGVPGRESRIGGEPWWSAQRVWTADGGQRDWAGRGVNHHWCPPPFGTRHLGRGRFDQTLRCEAAFVGSTVRSIHGPHREHLIAWARRRWGPRFRHIGRMPRTRLFHHRLNDLYASSTVALGDSAEAPRYWSDRVPRTLGRGGLLAHSRTAGLVEQGFDDSVMITYDRGEFGQIADRLAQLDAAARREMTERAIELVRERHLWRHRLADIAGALVPA
jgi:hypothetical protein